MMKRMGYFAASAAMLAGTGCAFMKDVADKVKEAAAAPPEAVVTGAHAVLNFLLGLFNILLSGVVKALLPF